MMNFKIKSTAGAENFTATADSFFSVLGIKARFCLLLSQPTKVSAARTGQ